MKTQDITAGDFKQRVLAIYNSVNRELWGAGVRQQRVDVLREQILVVAVHQRVAALASLDATRRDLTRQLDVALVDRYKVAFQAELEAAFDLDITAVLKDYDPVSELSCTLVVLGSPITFSSG